METFLRMAASLTALALGAVLLIADGGDDCDSYAGFQGRADYSAACTPLASGSGTVSLDIPASDSDNDGAVWDALESRLEQGGLHVSRLYIGYGGSCSGGKGRAVVENLHLVFKDATAREYVCDPLQLPVTQESTLSCRIRTTSDTWISGGEIPCALTFRPPAN